MKILVDADACPVVKQVEKIAKKHRVPVILLCDTNHILSSNYSEIKVIGAGADAVDIALANLCQSGGYCCYTGLRSCGSCTRQRRLCNSSVGKNIYK